MDKDVRSAINLLNTKTNPVLHWQTTPYPAGNCFPAGYGVKIFSKFPIETLYSFSKKVYTNSDNEISP